MGYNDYILLYPIALKFAFRFSLTAQGHEVNLFLMGVAVECDGMTYERYNMDAWWHFIFLTYQHGLITGIEILFCPCAFRFAPSDHAENGYNQCQCSKNKHHPL